MFTPSKSPGISGLHSVQGEGLAFANEWRQTMDVKSEPKQRPTSGRPAAASRTRQQQLEILLGRKCGATIAQLQKAFGWKPHTARAAISTLRKAGFSVERADTEKGAVYRVVGET